MSAMIVNADGSKTDAHNLDDLRERWLFRRQELAEVSPDVHPIAAPHNETDYLNPSTADECVTFLNELKTHLSNINLQRQSLEGTKFTIPRRWYMAAKLALSTERAYYDELCRQIGQKHQRFIAAPESEIVRLRRELKAANNRVNLLRDTIDANNGELEDWEVKLLSTVREKDYPGALSLIVLQMRMDTMTLKEAKALYKQERKDMTGK